MATKFLSRQEIERMDGDTTVLVHINRVCSQAVLLIRMMRTTSQVQQVDKDALKVLMEKLHSVDEYTVYLPFAVAEVRKCFQADKDFPANTFRRTICF